MQDITAVRTAFDSGQTDDAVMAVYDLVQRAGEQEDDQGAKTIRNELPGLVRTIERGGTHCTRTPVCVEASNGRRQAIS
jgi:hypothetical protein